MMQMILSCLLVLSLGTEKGNLCLKSDGFPLKVLGIPASVFPEKDQIALDQGIPVFSSDTLQALLEDYLS